MTETILKEHLHSSPLLDEAITIIVLEDQTVCQDAIREIIAESDLGWLTVFAQDKEGVERLAKEHNAVYYVLDINLGPEKSQEGITTAEFIKNSEQNTFVAMFSGVSNLAEFKKRASRVGVDYFEEKSGNIQWNVCRIALEVLRYQKHLITGILEGDRTSICKLEPLKVKSLTHQLKNINEKLAKIEELEISYSDSTASHLLASSTVITPPAITTTVITPPAITTTVITPPAITTVITPPAIKEDKNIQAYEA